MTHSDIRKALERPFPPEKLSWRIGPTNQKKIARETNNPKAKPTKGQILVYVDARDVAKRLDDVFGVMGWSATYPRDGYCEITVSHDNMTVTKGNYGVESQTEAEKGKASDAFKRAATYYGIARYLYKIHGPWVDLDERGNFNKKDIPQLPIWASQEGYDKLVEEGKI